MSHVVIVESPAKCKTINKYLGSDYTVLASFGHIRDLPSKDGSVRPDEDFAMDYQIAKDSSKHVKAITDAMKGADSLILATDPDREGEAISWHVLEALKQKKVLKKETKVQRVAFSSITKQAVTEAIENPREIDMDLVNAQQARRALDYLVGFNLSPVLWRKLPGSKSAGRVQSVALKLICEREGEIEKFDKQEYWSVTSEFVSGGKNFAAKLSNYDGKKLDKLAIKDSKQVEDIRSSLDGQKFNIIAVEKKQSKRNPYAPFTTSTLQQEASRKLGFGAKRTMQTAQKLYEGITLGGETTGLITYMRTDGVDVAPEALSAARDVVAKRFGDKYLPKSPRIYKKKLKNAQEAHEAIRPTDPARTPDMVRQYLNDDQFKLYNLIWKRLLASQMEPVILDQVGVDIQSENKKGIFRANGSTIRFDGFYAVYREGVDDPEDDDDEKTLPPLDKGQSLELNKLGKDDEKNPEGHNPFALQHFTQPPPRYTEASLVKKMEELGIGRPSTYAAILSVLQDRNYVVLEQKRFIPEARGRLVTSFLQSFFPRYVEYDFTAHLEDELDEISAGDLDWKEALRLFWNDFSVSVEGAMNLKFEDVTNELNRELDHLLFAGEGSLEERRKCKSCDTGTLGLRLGKFGAFVGCDNYPECSFTRQLSTDGNTDDADAPDGPQLLGEHPENKKEITMRKGPYGWYVQLGEAEGKEKPKRASLPKGTPPGDMTLEKAIGMLALPREVGLHPETGKMIKANIGRYGPYLQHDGAFTSIKGEDDVLTIGINRAVTVIAEAPKKKGAEPLKKLGEHPDGGEIGVYDGRYGPYVKYKKVNATLPKGSEPQDVTLEQAIELIAAKGGAKKKSAKKKPAAKKKSSKK